MKDYTYIFDLANEVIGDEIYDIVEEGFIDADSLANIVQTLAKELSRPFGETAYYIMLSDGNHITNKDNTITMDEEAQPLWGIKVLNNRNSFVTWQNDSRTGVSESLSYIHRFKFKTWTRDEVKDLLDMINEAWYNANN